MIKDIKNMSQSDYNSLLKLHEAYQALNETDKEDNSILIKKIYKHLNADLQLYMTCIGVRFFLLSLEEELTAAVLETH